MAGTSRTVTLNVVGSTAGAQKSLTDLASHSEGIGQRIHGAFSSVLGTLNQSGVLGPFSQVLDQLGGTFDNLAGKAHSFGKAMMGIGAGAAGIGGVLTAIAGPEEQASAQLKQAISSAGQNYDDFAGKIEKNIKSNEHFGHTSKDSMEAIRILTQATGDTGKALGDMGVVADLAAAKHISLAEAATSLARVHGGATKVLKEFGVEATKAGDNTKQLTAAQKAAESADAAYAKAKENEAMLHDRLAGKTKLTTAEQQSLQKAHEATTAAANKATEAHSKLASMHETLTTKAGAAETNIGKLGAKLDGQASAAANTFTGHLKAIGVEIEDNVAKLGQKYGPALMGIGAVVTTTGGIIDIFSKGQKAAALATEGLTVATEGEAVAMDGAAVSEGIALAPILLIIAGVALLGVGIYELVTHWKVVWDTISGIISGVWDWIAGHWPLLVSILFPPFAIGKLIFDHWGGILNFFAGIPGWFLHLFEDVGRGLANGFIFGINAVIGAWDWLMSLLKIPKFGIHQDLGPLGSIGFDFPGLDIGGALKISPLSYLAEGGIAMGPTLAVIGEAGPEAVVPLSQGGGMGFGGGGPIVLTVISEIDGRAVAKATHSYTRDEFLKLQRGTSAGRLSTVG